MLAPVNKIQALEKEVGFLLTAVLGVNKNPTSFFKAWILLTTILGVNKNTRILYTPLDTMLCGCLRSRFWAPIGDLLPGQNRISPRPPYQFPTVAESCYMPRFCVQAPPLGHNPTPQCRCLEFCTPLRPNPRICTHLVTHDDKMQEHAKILPLIRTKSSAL